MEASASVIPHCHWWLAAAPDTRLHLTDKVLTVPFGMIKPVSKAKVLLDGLVSLLRAYTQADLLAMATATSGDYH